MSNDLLTQIGVFVHEASGFPVGIGYGDTEHFEDLCDRAFAGPDAAGQTDA